MRISLLDALSPRPPQPFRRPACGLLARKDNPGGLIIANLSRALEHTHTQVRSACPARRENLVSWALPACRSINDGRPLAGSCAEARSACGRPRNLRAREDSAAAYDGLRPRAPCAAYKSLARDEDEDVDTRCAGRDSSRAAAAAEINEEDNA